MFNFDEFLIDSYLDSNNTPLYHFTDSWTLVNMILEDNSLKIGNFKNPTEMGDKNILSLTRDVNFKLEHRDNEVMICLDKNKLLNKYKIVSYDFYIHTKKDNHKKWEIDRKRFENEEIIYTEIKDLNKYILSIKFIDVNIYNEYKKQLSKFIDKYNLKIEY